MPGWFQKSCNPFSATSQPCELGTFASYSINVTGVEDIVAGISFTKKHNIRLVIKNKGHEYVSSNATRGHPPAIVSRKADFDFPPHSARQESRLEKVASLSGRTT